MATDPIHDTSFGHRFLQNENDTFEFNAWDNVDWPEERQEEIKRIIEVQENNCIPKNEAQLILKTSSGENWDKFYLHHGDKFFKNRKWIIRELPELGAGGIRALDVGCGAGSTTYPILEALDDVFMYCCDFSSEAIRTFNSNSYFPAGRFDAFVWDITESNDHISPLSLDIILCIYVLSAISPDKHQSAFSNLISKLKPGGILFIKDYHIYDLTQLRFGKDRFIAKNFYRRGDGTLVYFFGSDELDRLCSEERVEAKREMPLAEKSEKACSTREIYIEKEVQPPSKIARTLKHEENYLRAIPRAQQYEKSFMHRDVITHVFATQNDFIITASQDGHLKFWKKKYNEGVEFVKHYRCHLGAFADIALNHNGVLMATCCLNDRTVKIFDVQQFDMINMFKLNFSPRVLCWIHKGSDLINALAIGDVNSGKISVFDGNSGSAELHVIENVHQKPIILMKCAPERDVVISIDEGKMIEYWSGPKNNYGFPKSVSWEFKTDTDLYEFCKLKQTPVSLVISPNGQTFTIVSAERFVFIFDLSNARIIDKLDETLQHYIDIGKETKSHGLPTMEWNRRIAIEKEMSRDSEVFRSLQLAYDYTGNFLIYPTPLGINVYNIVTREVVRKLGFGENVRFLGVAICRATPSITEKLGAATTANIEAANNPLFRISEPDPMMIACAYKKNRFYIFTNVEPYSLESDETSNRDVFNEKPLKEDMITAVEEKVPQIKLCNYATIYTTYGDIHIELYPDKCPKTVENFCTHAKQGYYNGHVFHRVIKSFMIQTGDPTGRGTGGESIWGEDFEDEFHPLLRHDKAFRVSMANAGPNTNGSQFFITVCPAEWLDGKNTIFGQVVEGFNVVQKINQVPTYERTGRPKEDISIISISQKNV